MYIDVYLYVSLSDWNLDNNIVKSPHYITVTTGQIREKSQGNDVIEFLKIP